MLRFQHTLLILFCFILFSGAGFTQTKNGMEPIKPGKTEKGELVIQKGIPLLKISGTPQEMGRAHGKLLSKECEALSGLYLAPIAAMSGGVKAFKKRALKMWPHIPKRYQEEIKALAKACDKDFEVVLMGVAFPDIYRGGGCSTFAAADSATKDKKPLLGRNLDFFTMGVLDKYNLAIAYQPKGYYSFLSITWPSLMGVLSGMNEKGLCCAVMEVRNGKRKFEGMPSVLLFRRIMEEAGTVKEALKILKSSELVASNNLMIVEASGKAVVAELGPGVCNVREQDKGVVFATNHHRYGLKKKPSCKRFKRLRIITEEEHGALDVEKIKTALHKVNQGMISVQSMVFEPATLKIHLSFGAPPSTTGKYELLSFKEMIKGK